MCAIRLARAFTGKTTILKFEGGYHGMSAEFQMSLAPTRQVNFPQAIPDSAGIPQSVRDALLIAPFNDLAAVEMLLSEHDDIAAIIAEPLQRIIPPQPGVLISGQGAQVKSGPPLAQPGGGASASESKLGGPAAAPGSGEPGGPEAHRLSRPLRRAAALLRRRLSTGAAAPPGFEMAATSSEP